MKLDLSIQLIKF